MNNKQKGNITKFDIFNKDMLSLFILSIISGLASYFNKTNNSDPDDPKSKFSLTGLVAHILASVIAAFIADNILKATGITNENIRVAVIGLSGWGGVQTMEFLNYVGRVKILTFFGFTKHADRETYDQKPLNKPTTHAYTDPFSRPAIEPRKQLGERIEPTLDAPLESSSREARIARKLQQQKENQNNT